MLALWWFYIKNIIYRPHLIMPIVNTASVINDLIRKQTHKHIELVSPFLNWGGSIFSLFRVDNEKRMHLLHQSCLRIASRNPYSLYEFKQAFIANLASSKLYLARSSCLCVSSVRKWEGFYFNEKEDTSRTRLPVIQNSV